MIRLFLALAADTSARLRRGVVALTRMWVLRSTMERHERIYKSAIRNAQAAHEQRVAQLEAELLVVRTRLEQALRDVAQHRQGLDAALTMAEARRGRTLPAGEEPAEAAPITLPAGTRPCIKCGQPMWFGTAHYCVGQPAPERQVA